MIKERIMLIASILLLLLSGCLSVYATNAYISTSKEIDYSSKSSKVNLKSDNVQDAIDELDNICESRCPRGYICTKN